MNTSSFETPRLVPSHSMPSQPTDNNNSNNNQPVSTSGFAGKKSNKFFKQQQKQIHSLNFTTLFLMINQHKIIKKVSRLRRCQCQYEYLCWCWCQCHTREMLLMYDASIGTLTIGWTIRVKCCNFDDNNCEKVFRNIFHNRRAVAVVQL